MDYLELQRRANVLVNKVNEFEANLTGTEANENEVLDQHKYADTACLSPVLRTIFGADVATKTNRDLTLPTDLWFFSSNSPANITRFTPFVDTSQTPGNYLQSWIEPQGNVSINYDTGVASLNDNTSQFIINNSVSTSSGITTIIDFTTGSNINYGQYLTVAPERFLINLENGSLRAIGISSGSWVTIKTGVQANTHYRIKATISSTNQKYEQINDDGTTTELVSFTDSNINFSSTGVWYFGNSADHYYFQGTINLINSSINGQSMMYHVSGPGFETTTKEFIQNIDMMNNYNMLQLDVKENTVVNKEDRIKQGINYSQSVHINDAMLVESQVANLFKWNTTSEDDIENNVIVNNRQVPGIVCYYLGNNYDSSYTATLPQNKTNKLNGLTYSYPTYYGAYYTKDEATSQVGQYPGSECLRMFIPGMFYTSGVLRSPQQIWLPDVKFGNDNIDYGYNWQAQGLYHELVFKNKRKNTDSAQVTKEVYDSSKFNIVGNPTITDDGIASGFSTSNYVSVSCNINNNTELVVNFKCKFDTVEQRIWSALGSGSTQHYLTLVQTSDNKLELRVPDVNNSFYNAVFIYNLKDNEDIWVKLKIKGKDAQGFISINGINWELKGTTTVYENLASLVSGTIYLGALEQYSFAGSTDLKELKITVNDNIVFKGTKTVPEKVKLDFIPGLDSVSDNDEQGFATRLALAKQKKFYKNRPWFTELDSLSGLDASKLADSIDEKSKNSEGAALTDTEFYTSYKLDYNTFADSYNI